jgi:hypothetical protein
MRFFAKLGIATSLTLSVLLVPSATLAAQFDHVPWSGDATQPDFCGSGVTVDLTYSGTVNAAPDKETGHVVTTYTNPLNGASANVSISGNQVVKFVDDADGGFTIVFKAAGIPIKVQPAGGGKGLLKDVGDITFYDHFDAGENYLGTDMVIHGPHPSIESPDLFCEVMTEALGL